MTGIIQGLLASLGGVISDAYFNLVTLLLPGNGTNGAQNNTFLDSSTNNFTITRNGNTTQGTFTPFSQTGWGNFFDGTGDYLSNTSTALITNTVSTFTVECWIYLTATPPADVNNISALCTLDGQPTGPTNYLSFGPKNDGKLYLFWFDGAVKSAAGGTALALNTWYHIACVVNSNAIQFYVNGVAETMSGTTTLTNRSGSQGNFAVGSSSAGQITGYISNFRVTTTAVYTSAFTPPTSALTNITNTKLLTCQSNQFVDNSSNAYALTINGTPSVQAFSPFLPTAAYTTTDVGGSGYFDGTGDNLALPSSSNLAFGTGDFCVEFWFYRTGTTGGLYSNAVSAGGGDAQFEIQLNGTNKVILIGWNTTFMTGATTINANTWYHIAVVRSGTSMAIFVNGTRDATATSANNFSSTNAFVIGAQAGGVGTTIGYISSLRSVKGAFVYDPSSTTVTIPTAPVTAITNTQLLLNFTNAGITDATAKNDLETVGNAQISTTQSKFGGSSMYFDGTGDWLTVIDNPNLQMGSGDFTIEGWFYLSATGVAYGIVSKGTSTTGWSVNITSGNKLQFSYTSSNLTGATTLSSATWYYFAVVRSGTATGNLKIYLNGSDDATSAGAVTDNFNQTSIMYVGADRVGTSALNGYIDDLRITKGYARTIATPSSAFPLQ